MEEPDVSIRRDEPMSAMPSERLERRPMSYDEFLALPEHVRAEWVDGVAIMSPPARRPHNRVARRLANLVETACPDLEVDTESGVRTGERKYRIPDVSVIPVMDDAVFTEVIPVMVVEVLSPSSRSEDTLRKSGEYLAAGIGQYWIVDPTYHSLTVLGAGAEGWEIVLELDETHPTGEVTVGEHGVVPIDLATLLAP